MRQEKHFLVKYIVSLMAHSVCSKWSDALKSFDHPSQREKILAARWSIIHQRWAPFSRRGASRDRNTHWSALLFFHQTMTQRRGPHAWGNFWVRGAGCRVMNIHGRWRLDSSSNAKHLHPHYLFLICLILFKFCKLAVSVLRILGWSSGITLPELPSISCQEMKFAQAKLVINKQAQYFFVLIKTQRIYQWE